MTAPKLAISRPAALTGTIGQGGLNRVHDVALVQALLGAKRAKGGRHWVKQLLNERNGYRGHTYND